MYSEKKKDSYTYEELATYLPLWGRGMHQPSAEVPECTTIPQYGDNEEEANWGLDMMGLKKKKAESLV